MPHKSKSVQKPLVSLGAVGHAGHGKTTLMASVVAVQERKGLAASRSLTAMLGGAAPVEVLQSEGQVLDHVEFETAKRHYIWTDWASHGDLARNVITGAAQIDGAVLVVSSADGPTPQTREQLLILRSVGVMHLVVFLSMVDLVPDVDLVDLVEVEVRALLNQYRYPGDRIVVVRGSASAAIAGNPEGEIAIASLVDAMDAEIPEPARSTDLPLLMSIEDIFEIAGRGTVVTGRIERGRIKVGDTVELVGLRETRATVVTGIEFRRRYLDEGQAGDNIGVFLEGISRNDVERGQVIAAPQTIAPRTRALAEIYVLSPDEGGRRAPFFHGFRPQFYFRTADVNGTTTLPPGVEMVLPGDNITVGLELSAPIAMEPNQRFAIREGGRTIAAGRIIEVLPDVMPDEPPRSERESQPQSGGIRFGPVGGSRAPFLHVTAAESRAPFLHATGTTTPFLERRVVNARLDGVGPGGSVCSLDPSRSLDPNANYRLAVQIGRRSWRSLIRRAPSIEDTLPPLEPSYRGWELEAVVFPKDFELLTPDVLPLLLPRHGESEWVHFQLRAPPWGTRVYLRLSIYCQNHLLQSFALTASLDPHESGGGDGLRMVCDFSQTRDFANLDTLRPRAISFALNDDGNSGSHRLFVKGSSVKREIELNETAMKEDTKAFRQILADVGRDSNGNARFARKPEPETRPEFDAAVRRLAILGNELFRKFFADNRDLAEKLKRLPQAPIQIVRHKSDHAYPWPILYDFRLPQETLGAQGARVCLGPQDPSPCGCTRETAQGYCLNGFWGIRHELELLVGQNFVPPDQADPDGGRSSLRNASSEIRWSRAQPKIAMIVDEDEIITASLARRLADRYKSDFIPWDQPIQHVNDLLNRLWDHVARPPLVVTFGHLKESDKSGEPRGPRIALRSRKAWLQPRLIDDKVIDAGQWRDPSSLVFLMICESAATEIAQANDFSRAFLAAGSSGVVGAETYIFRGQASDLVDFIISDLVAGKTMGQAMKRYWYECMSQGNPLAFGVSYAGSADLRFQ